MKFKWCERRIGSPQPVKRSNARFTPNTVEQLDDDKEIPDETDELGCSEASNSHLAVS